MKIKELEWKFINGKHIKYRSENIFEFMQYEIHFYERPKHDKYSAHFRIGGQYTIKIESTNGMQEASDVCQQHFETEIKKLLEV